MGSWVARLKYEGEMNSYSLYADKFFEDHSGMFFLDYDGYGTGNEWQQKKKRRLSYIRNERLVVRIRISSPCRQLVEYHSVRVHLFKVSKWTNLSRPYTNHCRPYWWKRRLLQPLHLSGLSALGADYGKSTLSFAIYNNNGK